LFYFGWALNKQIAASRFGIRYIPTSKVKVLPINFYAYEFTPKPDACGTGRARAHEWINHHVAGITEKINQVAHKRLGLNSWMLAFSLAAIEFCMRINTMPAAAIPGACAFSGPAGRYTFIAHAWTVAGKLRHAVGLNPYLRTPPLDPTGFH
jgi:hypothetical protein